MNDIWIYLVSFVGAIGTGVTIALWRNDRAYQVGRSRRRRRAHVSSGAKKPALR